MNQMVLSIAVVLAVVLVAIFLWPVAESDPCAATGGRWNYDAGICEK